MARIGKGVMEDITQPAEKGPTTDDRTTCVACGDALATNGRVTVSDEAGGAAVVCAACADETGAGLVAGTDEADRTRLYLAPGAWGFTATLIDRFQRRLRFDSALREFADFDGFSRGDAMVLAGRVDARTAGSVAVGRTDLTIIRAAVGLFNAGRLADEVTAGAGVVDHVERRVDLAARELDLDIGDASGVDA